MTCRETIRYPTGFYYGFKLVFFISKNNIYATINNGVNISLECENTDYLLRKEHTWIKLENKYKSKFENLPSDPE